MCFAQQRQRRVEDFLEVGEVLILVEISVRREPLVHVSPLVRLTP
jgi:hypothetical protein